MDRKILKRRQGEPDFSFIRRLRADRQVSSVASKTKARPSEISSVKRGWRRCEYPGCTEDARYYGVKKGVKHFFCVPHFKKYYHMPNL